MYKTRKVAQKGEWTRFVCVHVDKGYAGDV